MGQDIEQKLKIEGEITALKKEHKRYISLIDDLKKESIELLKTKERTEKLIDENKTYLNEVMNDISDAKLKWATQKDSEMELIEKLKMDANKVLERIAEIDEKTEKDNQILDKNTNILNENRRLMLSIEQEKTAFDAEKRVFENDKNDFSQQKTDFENMKVEFKERLKSLINDYE